MMSRRSVALGEKVTRMFSSTPSTAIARLSILSRQVLKPIDQSIRAFPLLRSLSTSAKMSMSSPENNNDFLLENLFNVRGKVAVVSGGGSGIGLMATQGAYRNSMTLTRG